VTPDAEYEIERDQHARADAVYERIEELSERLAGVLAVSYFLHAIVQVKEAEASDLKDRIHDLHVERDRIFHEGEQA
jgi:hypothetical protein